MLQIQGICKTYKTGDLVQRALDNVQLNLRDNEFVAVLGPSGSGKTTLLNIIGGLDRYDSGDLIINGISTRQYKDRDWDSYRNHTIGFVFQSYNLIPHQSVLANVELALTISGVSRAERRKRAAQALERVGLGNQLHKRPNQLSGGQMQRVAIARALVNEPDILLADEPTGALDSETSVQVMELLKEVARDKLVVMVTHNPDLAEKYATRIVNLRDGKIVGDSDPYLVDTAALAPPKHKNMGRSSMSVFTSLALSFNNLRTKKGRTFLTAFAGSIGIIGIALILSLSTGVNTYIDDIQKEAMTSYPLTIDAQTIDLSSLLKGGSVSTAREADHALDGVYSNTLGVEMASMMTTSLTENNLTAFKKYLDDPASEIHQYVGENGITYNYGVKFNVYTRDPDGTLVTTNGVTIGGAQQKMMSGMSQMAATSTMSSMMTSGNFGQLLPGTDGELVGSAIRDSYDLLYGSWPQNYDEVVLILDRNNEIEQTTLYELGLLPSADYTAMMKSFSNGEKLETESVRWSYADACKQKFYLLAACDQYTENEDGTYRFAAETAADVENLLDRAIELKIVGVVRPQSDQAAGYVMNPVGYTQALTDYLIAHTDESAVVTAQRESAEKNILSGLEFAPSDDAAKAADAAAYLASLGVSEKAALCSQMMQSSGQSAMLVQMDETQLAAMFDQYLQNPDQATLVALYDANISTGSYDENMQAFGVVSPDAPVSISIYADSFEAKDAISDCIDRYNAGAADADQITYTDYVGLLMSSVTTIVNVISYVLIAFVAVSLVVSSIMIGIITYISVLERTKEIGILRAIGASRRNISQVFNAETFIIGLCSGLLGIGVTLLLLLPGNAIIHHLTGTPDVNAILPAQGAVILVILSVILTLIGGLIPSRKAAKKDPVTALRTE